MNTKRTIIILIIALIVLGIAWWLAPPLWRQTIKNEDAPSNSSAQMQANANAESDATNAATNTASTNTEAENAAPIESVAGEFQDGAHDVSGEARIVLADGQKVLRFENFYTLNGPDLRVYLATDNTANDFVDLGALPATQGNYNITVPDSVDLGKYDTVLIWCRAFGVLFGSAELR
jgi:hypothetical protein